MKIGCIMNSQHSQEVSRQFDHEMKVHGSWVRWVAQRRPVRLGQRSALTNPVHPDKLLDLDLGPTRCEILAAPNPGSSHNSPHHRKNQPLCFALDHASGAPIAACNDIMSFRR